MVVVIFGTTALITKGFGWLTSLEHEQKPMKQILKHRSSAGVNPRLMISQAGQWGRHRFSARLSPFCREPIRVDLNPVMTDGDRERELDPGLSAVDSSYIMLYSSSPIIFTTNATLKWC